MRNSYFLTIPKQHGNPSRVKEFEERFLQQWVSQLPVANPGLSTRLLFDLLLEMNSLIMPPQLRLDSLELIQPVFRIVEGYLRPKLYKGNFPKDLTEQKSLKLLVEVERQLAIGYWIVAKALTAGPIGWLRGKQAALSVQRCLMGLGGILANYYIMAMAAPDWVWLDLHSLYKLSVKVNINNTQVPVINHDQAGATQSPENCYLHCVLLCLAHPYGLMGKEISQVERLSQQLSKLVKLKESPVAGQSGQCLIFTDEDKAPFFQNLIEAGPPIKPSSAVLYVDFSRLYQYVGSNKIALGEDRTRFSARGSDGFELISPELLIYLRQRWSGAVFGNSELFSDRLDQLISIGLVNTHQLLSSPAVSVDNSEYLAHSVSGKLLAADFRIPNVISVGSLVSLRKVDAPKKQRLLAVVNEIFAYREENKLNFGLKLLASQCIPCAYTCRDGVDSERQGNALLFKQEENANTRIIVDNSVFKEGDKLSLTVNQKEFNVTIHNKLNVALGYWQFDCKRLSS